MVLNGFNYSKKTQKHNKIHCLYSAKSLEIFDRIWVCQLLCQQILVERPYCQYCGLVIPHSMHCSFILGGKYLEMKWMALLEPILDANIINSIIKI